MGTLMQEWPPEFEKLLSEIKLPSADLNVKLNLYVPIICALCDIPVYKKEREGQGPGTGMVEALHLLFSTYIEFKNSQHFAARGGAEGEDDDPEAVAADAAGINAEPEMWTND